MASSHVLSIPRSDSDGESVLVNVSPNGKATLDLELLATEGTSPFITTIKHSNVSKYMVKNSTIDTSRWEIILKSLLLQQRNLEGASEALKNLETVASVSGTRLVIIFRKNISGIHQRVGEISLSQDDSQEIDTIAWAHTAIARANTLSEEVQTFQTHLQSKEAAIQKLNAQLEDLITAKKQHEASLLEKFRELLNAKKLKIRDQQRLLATVHVDAMTAKQVKASRSPSIPTTAARASRRNKRKQQTIEPSDSEDAGFEPMAVDKADPTIDEGAADDDEVALDQDENRATPDKSDLDATEDEDDDDLDNDGPSTQAAHSGAGNKGKLIENGKAEGKGNRAEPPPRRELPFTRAKGKVQEEVVEDSSNTVVQARDDDTVMAGVEEDDLSTEDDEL